MSLHQYKKKRSIRKKSRIKKKLSRSCKKKSRIKKKLSRLYRKKSRIKKKKDGSVEILNKSLEEEDMRKFEKKYKNNVVKIICQTRQKNPFKPYSESSEDFEVSGTGFIVDINRGLILTNAHVTSNAFNIYALIQEFGKYQCVLKLVSICTEKDVALCQLSKNDIERIKNIKIDDENNRELKFSDSFKIFKSMKVYVVGYPLGTPSLIVTNGTISGHFNNFSEEDTTLYLENSPTYIETDSPINPGNSGGPLIDKDGKVIGINSAGMIFAQNKGFVIGCRTFLSVIKELTKPLKDENLKTPYVVSSAKFSFSYNGCNNDVLKKCKDTCKTSHEPSGILINKVLKNSCFYGALKEGDILHKIEFEDVYTKVDCLNAIIQNDGNNCIGGEKVCAIIQNDGFINSITKCSDNSIQTDRMFTNIKEISDSIPIDTEIKLNVYRKELHSEDRHALELTCQFESRDKKANLNKQIIDEFEDYIYRICYGMCICELKPNHVYSGDGKYRDILNKYIQDDNVFEKFLIITKSFPNTENFKSKIFKNGTILKKVNNIEVSDIQSLENALSKTVDGNVKFEGYVQNDVVGTLLVDEQKHSECAPSIMKTFNIDSRHFSPKV